MRFCRECIYYNKFTGNCRNSNVKKKYKDEKENGWDDFINPPPKIIFIKARRARARENLCGMAGTYWEPKEHWKKLFNKLGAM